jgi:peptide/nickel transport system permease protein
MAVAEPIAVAQGRGFVARGRGVLAPSRARTRALSVGAASLFGVVTIVAALGRIIAPHDPTMPAGIPLSSPGANGYLLGSDAIGRDIFSRLLFGIQASWFAALVVIAIGVAVGGVIGLVAGATGGWVDNLLMRITDLFLALPAPVLAIAVVAAMGHGFTHTLIAVSIVWWPFYARIVRGEITKLAARHHVEAARLAGAGRVRVALRHLLPGAIPAIIVTASLDVGNLILTLAGLSFLGLGQTQPAPELGADSANGMQYLLQQWWVPVMPGIAVVVLALIANTAGDGVRRLLDRD